jgi:hypothetical protein
MTNNNISIINKKNESKQAEQIEFIVNKINGAISHNHSGNISFEINMSQGGIRTIKYSSEGLVKF